MKRLLTLGLSLGLLCALVVPGVATGAEGGKSELAKACKADYASYGFKNVGQCTRFFVQGGTVHDLFAPRCEVAGGTYAENWSDDWWGSYPHLKALMPFPMACLWDGISKEDWVAWQSYCPVGMGGQNGWTDAYDPDFAACYPKP